MLVVNEHEVAIVAAALGLAGAPDDLARQIDADHGVATIVTLGGEGAVGWTGGVRRDAPALPVELVDTTAAGDTLLRRLRGRPGPGSRLHHGPGEGGRRRQPRLRRRPAPSRASRAKTAIDAAAAGFLA